MMMMMMMIMRTTMIVMVIGVDVAAWPARESASHPSLLCRDAVGYHDERRRDLHVVEQVLMIF